MVGGTDAKDINIMVQYQKMKTNDMNNKELVEKKIHDFILKVYKAKYTLGRLEVTNKENGMYILLLGVPSPDFPTTNIFTNKRSQKSF